MIKYFVVFIQFSLVFPSIIRSDVAKWIQIDKFQSIPARSIRGGYDKNGQETYICTSFNPTSDNIIPGSLSKDGACKVIDNGNEITLNKGYRILTNMDGVWIPFFDSKIPTNALETGQYDNNGEMFTFFSGRKHFDNTLSLGKILYTGVGYGQGYYGSGNPENGLEEIYTAVPKIIFLNNKLSTRMTFSGFFIVFKVKTSNAAIYLGVDEEDEPRYQITFDSKRNETIFEFKRTKEAIVIPSQNVISNDEMRAFWIFLDSNIKIGKEGSADPIFTLKNVDLFMTSAIWVQFGSSTNSEWRIPTYELLK